MNESFSKNGMFDTPVGELHGRLTLDADDSLLELWDTKYPWGPDGITNFSPIKGILEDQKHVSLFEFAWVRMGGAFGPTGDTSHYSLFPLFAVVGATPFGGKISQISFNVDDAEVIFYDQEAFGCLGFGQEKKARTILRNAGIDTGDPPNAPYLTYWTGKGVILSADASPGKVSVWNSPTLASTSETAVAKMTNRVVVSVKFPEPVTEMRDLWKIVSRFTRFLGIVAGRPQNILALRIIDDESTDPSSWDVYFPTFPQRSEEDENEKPTRRGPLVDAADKPDDFSRLMVNWLEKDKDDARHRARVRFFNGWSKQRRYDEGRLIGAASVFDLLPREAHPAARAKLHKKVKHRAASIGHGLPEIDFVIDAAVELRNEYVHGPRPNREPWAVSGKTLIFLTQTLEFIFVVAELHESGWDFQSWERGGRHPITEYLVGYDENLAQLKEEKARRRR